MTVRQGLHIIQSNRLELLAHRLMSDLSAVPLISPLQPELVVVQDSTVSDWLDILLARQQGVSANMRYRSPGQFIWDLYRCATPSLPPHSAFDVETLQWHIVRIFDDESFIAHHPPLRSYLSKGDSIRRFELALRVAELLNRYLVYRMDWLEHWESGTLLNLGPDESWQAEIWKRLTTTLQQPNRAHLFRMFLAQVEKRVEGLPPRVSVFGISSLSPAYVTLLEALGTQTDVRVYVLNPCREKWDDIADERYRVRTDLKSSAELMHIDVPHALLGSLGKQGRDFIRMVVEAEGVGAGVESMFEDPGHSSILHALQSGVLRLSEDAVSPAADDGSIQVHSCHTRMREVEVLRDHLLALLDEDRTLLPSDILVLAPDIDIYAPYIEAVFPRRSPVDPAMQLRRVALPYDIADRSTRSVDVAAEAWRLLLELPRTRCDAEQVLDLLRMEPLRTSFGIAFGELDTLYDWVAESGIRWGFSGDQKLLWELPPSDHFTWIWGLERMVLGVGLPRALAGDDLPLFHGFLPVDTIEGRRVDLLDRFIGFVDALRGWVQDLQTPRPMVEWGEFLSEWLDRFIGPGKEHLESRESIRETIVRTVAASDEAGYHDPVDGAALRSLLLASEPASASGARFPGGGITFSSMKPLRPLPFRVIAVLGMADGEFPRTVKPPSFDLMQSWYRHGDRSARLDDRYLFLELLLSARDLFHLSYIGEDVQSGKPRPMSPVVAELMEFLATVCFGNAEDGVSDSMAKITASLHVTHPLQAFSRSYFDGRDTRLFSYAGEAARIARGVGQGTDTHHALFSSPLPDPGEEFRRVRLDDLCRFYRNPVQYLFQKRLGVRFRDEDDVAEIQEPLAVGKAETRAIYRALYQFLSTRDPDGDALQSYLQADGRLPLGVPGRFGFDRVFREAGPFVDACRRLQQETTLPPLVGELSFGRWILEVHQNGVTTKGLSVIQPGKVYDGDTIAFWVRLLVISLLHPHRDSGSVRGRLLGANALLDFPQPAAAEETVGQLLAWYGEGLRQPLHFFPGMALSYAHAIETKDPEGALAGLRKTWDVSNSYAPFQEHREAYVARTFFSGDEALNEEFVALATVIAVQALRGLVLTDFTKQRK